MIAIIAAMDEEIEAIIKLGNNFDLKKFNEIDFYLGKLANRDVVITKSGVGKVNAAISTTILISNFKIDYIINIGSAGSLDSKIRIGSIVIPPIVSQHDCEVPGWPNNFENEKRTFRADNNLLAKAKKLSDDKTFFVPMVSGDSFIYLKEQTEKIIRDFPLAKCCEMEGAAIAQTATFLNIPFIIIRAISDVTIEENSEISFEEFLKIASKNSALYCKNFIALED